MILRSKSEASRTIILSQHTTKVRRRQFSLTRPRVYSIACSVLNKGLRSTGKVAVHQHELPHARPDSHALIVLGCACLGQAIVKLLQHIMFNAMQSAPRDAPKACLSRQRQRRQLVFRVLAVEKRCLPDSEETVHLVYFADETVLHQLVSIVQEEAASRKHLENGHTLGRPWPSLT